MNADSLPNLPEREQATAEDAELAQVLDGYLTALEAGQAPDPERLLAEHPRIASRLRACLAGLQVIKQVAGSFAGAETGTARALEPECLGDFRIVRQVGRGGMGVVYEAEQRSLGRRVALKVLPLAGTLDERHLRRFKNEALAAAHLDHPNIVDVLGVGSERGVHYYAMRFIEGQTLADIIRHLREGRECARGTAAGPDADLASAPTRATGSLSTWDAPRGTAFFRWVAELGAQVAEALEQAHQQGIIHRDIKPSNLLLDERGKPWVTDFGLAQMQCDVKLTQTGDLVGTLRYMSPEQALARRAVLDHRSDLYSLGATLYELLTLKPAFDGRDREELLRQIAFEEPVPPRRRDRSIPAELETIVLKALEKNPQERYATARELADDLRRHQRDEPIRARRPTLLQRGRKWARRHQPVVWAAAVVFLLAAMLGSGTWVWLWQKQVAAEQEVERVLKEAVNFQEQGKKPEALAAARQASSLLPGATISRELQRRVGQRLADLEMDARLEDIRLVRAGLIESATGYGLSDTAYEQAFREYSIDVAVLPPEEATQRIQRTSIPAELAAALADWSWVRNKVRGKDDPTWKELLALACAADLDEWRNRVRHALEQRDVKALKELAASERTAYLPPSTLVLMGGVLGQTGAGEQAVALLRQAQRKYPGDFGLNHELAVQLKEGGQEVHWDEAIRFYTAALALRPQSVAVHNNLGIVLQAKGRLDKAIAEIHEAIRLKKDYAHAHSNRGLALQRKGRLDEAIAAYHEAIRLKKDYAGARINLGNTLLRKGLSDEAIAAYQEAIRLNKKIPQAHNGLGNVLYHKGQLDEAIAAYRIAVGLGMKQASTALHACERELTLRRRLPGLIAGQDRPADPAERLEFARLCQEPFERRYALAARLYADAFTAEPKLADDLNAGQRYNAACAAALAGCGEGQDADKLTSEERARLRRQALDWLRADLAAWHKVLEGNGSKAASAIQKQMQHWLQDSDFAGVRGREALARLPEEERQPWQKLWADVQGLLNRAG